MDKHDDILNQTNTSYLPYNDSQTMLNSFGQSANKKQQQKISSCFYHFCFFHDFIS